MWRSSEIEMREKEKEMQHTLRGNTWSGKVLSQKDGRRFYFRFACGSIELNKRERKNHIHLGPRDNVLHMPRAQFYWHLCQRHAQMSNKRYWLIQIPWTRQQHFCRAAIVLSPHCTYKFQYSKHIGSSFFCSVLLKIRRTLRNLYCSFLNSSNFITCRCDLFLQMTGVFVAVSTLTECLF